MESHRQPRLAGILSDIVNKVSTVIVIDFKKYGMAFNVKSLLLFQENQGAPFDKLTVMHIGAGTGIEVEVVIGLLGPV
jgi:hypothetical protein